MWVIAGLWISGVALGVVIGVFLVWILFLRRIS